MWSVPVFGARAGDVERTLDSTQVGTAPASDSGDAIETHDPIVALFNDRGFACSGVLVHPKAVLSARHCRGIAVAVFGNDVSRFRAQRRVVNSLVPSEREVDLAVFVLDDAAPVEPYVVSYPAQPPSEVRIVGFGCLDAACRASAGHRTFFDAPLRPADWGCEPSVAARLGCRPGLELVLNRAEAADTCVGDSGGGVLVRTGNTWALIAITSRSAADSFLRCGDGGVYTRLSPYEHWLMTVLRGL
jgi:hypothetical protein